GSSLACEVSAVDADGISKLEWLLDGRLVFTETSSPFNYCNISSLAAGTHTVTARATDKKGAIGQAQVTVTAGSTSGGDSTGGTTNPAPLVSFSKPANNTNVAVGGSVACAVSATDADGIAKLEWLLDGRVINTEFGSPYDTCNVSGLTAGTHVIKARATDKKGAVGEAQVTVTAGTTSGGDSTGGTTNTPPAISISAPGNNATVAAGSLSCYASATDANGIAKVEWFLDGRLINTEFGSPYDSCNISTSGMSGAHVIKARATDKLGAVSEAQVTVNVGTSSGGDSTGGGGTSTGSIDGSDIKTRATADLLFSTQPNIYADILGSSPWMSTVPESGAHGSTLPNGETIRFGKQTDPLNSSRKALSFQLAPSDPTTGGSKRVELGFPRNIEYNKTYWLAVSVYAHDWGTLSTSDQALFGFQLHNGTKIDLSPTIALYTTGNGRSMQIQTRYSTSGSPSQSNSVTQKWPAQAIPFGRWMDFVVKFRNNVSGQGYAQVWLDGNLIVNHQGNLGFNTPGYLDFVKWGYYNWTSGFASPRKVRLRNPTLVADPTGSKYTASEIRTILTGGTSSTSTAATGTVQ
ncbi:MAG: repeat-containing protein, partial [Burkholderiales bacterium]|nr:repeat-containing protein [Burkholderiales bacterium]